jgi:subtilisin family serine protease
MVFSDTAHIANFIAALQNLSVVEFAERIPKMYALMLPSDPQVLPSNTANNYHLYRSNFLSATGNGAYDLPNISSGQPVTVAVVDDALYTSHTDLAANMWNGVVSHGFDVANNDGDPNPPSNASPNSFSHGTHVAGIIGAVTNNTIGIASIGMNQIRLMGIKTALDSDGLALVAAYEGVAMAVSKGAKIINCSWGGGYSQAQYNIIVDAYNAGCIIVASAGNTYTSTPKYPAAFGEGLTGQTWEVTNKKLVISVAALDNQDNRAYWGLNQLGIPRGSNIGSYVDISAYGTDIYSTVVASGGGSDYTKYNGTSMAAPQVSGLLGLMMSYNPTASRDQVLDCLLGTANQDIYNLSLHPNHALNSLGSGRIDARKALECIKPLCAQNPVVAITANRGNLCPNGTITLSANIGNIPNGSISYQWSNNNNGQSISVSTVGIYTVTATLTTTTGTCSTSRSYTVLPVTIPTPLTISSTLNSALCENPAIMLFTTDPPITAMNYD